MKLDDLASLPGTLGAIMTSLLAGGALVWRAYTRVKRVTQADNSDASTLKLMDAALAQWKGLHDEAWAQVRKERELREAAEHRIAMLLDQAAKDRLKDRETIEALRGRVAELEREVGSLQSIIGGRRSGERKV